MTVLPAPPPGRRRRYWAATDGRQVYALHTDEEGRAGLVEQWQPGVGWLDAPWAAGPVLGPDLDGDIEQVSPERAEELAPGVRVIPDEGLEALSRGHLRVSQAL